MTSNLSAKVGILKDVIVMEDNNLDMNLASVARFDKAGCHADGNTLVESTLTNDFYIFDIRDTMRHQKAMLART